MELKIYTPGNKQPVAQITIDYYSNILPERNTIRKKMKETFNNLLKRNDTHALFSDEEPKPFLTGIDGKCRFCSGTGKTWLDPKGYTIPCIQGCKPKQKETT